MENIANRIQKLFALADSTHSEAEAQAATLKAQELIHKYNIENWNLDETAREIVWTVVEYNQKRRRSFQYELARVIATNFRCKHFLRNNLEGSGYDVVFLGYEEDTIAARETFIRLYEIILSNINRLKRELRQAGTPQQGHAASYARGFIVGIRNELGKQSKALVIVTPKAVEEEFENMNLDKASVGPRSDFEAGSYEQGVRDGKNSMAKKELGRS